MDVYYDNVRGQTLNLLIQRIAVHGRIILCGVISQGHGRDPLAPLAYPLLMFRSITMHGFLIFNHMERFDPASLELARLVREGKIVAREDVVTGLENAPLALARLFAGENIGKQLVKVAEPER